MRRALYTDDHEQYRSAVREFLAREVEPHFLRWEQERLIDRTVFRAAAEQGVYALGVPEAHGGAGETDYRYRMIVNEECARLGATSFNMTLGLQDDLVLAYLLDLTTDAQKKRWLEPFARGELLGALAMTEPGTGSDLQGIRTSAVRDGDDWVVDGAKTFISSAHTADVVIVAVYEATARYCFERTAFDRPIGDFQHTRFVLAEMETELDVAEAFVDRCVLAFNAGELTPVDAAKGKWYLSELQKRVTDRCVQLYGGYGYMLEYPVARAFVDGRVQTIYGGTTEIMKELIGRDIARQHR